MNASMDVDDAALRARQRSNQSRVLIAE
jgi:hypothetical protein